MTLFDIKGLIQLTWLQLIGQILRGEKKTPKPSKRNESIKQQGKWKTGLLG